LVVAQDLVESLAAKCGVTFTPLATFKGSVLEGCTYKHPLYDRTSPVVIGGDYITTESGTGLVHTAPGHGQEDYQVGGLWLLGGRCVASEYWRGGEGSWGWQEEKQGWGGGT
jgi:isoleucyl-tRNA synthetase